MKITIPLILLLFTYVRVSAQAQRERVIGAYIYKFIQFSNNCTDKDTYNVSLITENKSKIEAILNIVNEVNKKNLKKINVTTSSDANINYSDACMIFIARDKIDLYRYIFKETKGTNIILISENHKNKEEILLNIYDTKDNKVKFEINKGNIYSRGIDIDDQVFLLGGTIVDVKRLYNESQEKLENTNLELKEKLDSIEALRDKLFANQEKIRKQIDNLNNQNRLILQQKEEIQSFEYQIQDQQKAFIESQNKLSIINDSLKGLTSSLKEYDDKIKDNNRILTDQKQKIKDKEKELEKQQSEIKENRLLLSQKLKVIKWQRNIVIFFSVGTLITLILFTLFLKNYIDKKRKNNLLNEQKQKISNQYKELKKQNDLIESIIDELSEKNEELTTTLEENERIQIKLVESEKMASLGVLSAGIAHEINNPINFVHAGINSLMRDFEDIEPVINEVDKLDVDQDNLKEKIQLIKKLKKENYYDDAIEAIPHIIKDIKVGAERTAEIVKGLRNFARMDQDVYEPLKINEGIETSLLLLKNKYKNSIEIVKNYAENLPELTCYPGKINQALLNILSNAIDAIEDKGKIWISTYLVEKNICITIVDNGCGIPEKALSKIFDPFFTTKPVGKGTGLGLSITYGIINEHGGSINVNSEVNEGTEFIITLPLN